MFKKRRGTQLVLFICFITMLKLAEATPIGNVVGFKKVKAIVLEHSNLYSLAEDFFGSIKNVFGHRIFLEVDLPYREVEEIENGIIVRQDNPLVYSDYEGLVIEVGEDFFVFQTSFNQFRVENLIEVRVALYQHISVNQVVATCHEEGGKFTYRVLNR